MDITAGKSGDPFEYVSDLKSWYLDFWVEGTGKLQGKMLKYAWFMMVILLVKLVALKQPSLLYLVDLVDWVDHEA